MSKNEITLHVSSFFIKKREVTPGITNKLMTLVLMWDSESESVIITVN